MKQLLAIWLLLALASWAQNGPQVGIPAGGKLVPSTPTAAEPGGVKSQSCSGSDKMVGIDANGNIVCAADQGGAGVPSGAVVMIVSGSCSATLGSGWSEETSLSGKFALGTAAANGDIASTGGSDSVTPAGTVSQPSFTGSSFTPAGTVSQPAFTGTPFTQVINHTHTVTVTWNVQGGTSASTSGTHVMTSSSTGGSARAPTSGDVVSATTANPSGGVSSITPAGTVSQPTFTGTPGTPAGTVSQPAFTGTAFDNRPAFVKVIFCKKD